MVDDTTPFMLEDVFRSPEPGRDKFLSRLFGLSNEEVVRAWAADERAPYEDLGRPTLRWPADAAWHTLDFTLRRRSDGAVFVAEMKCDLEFEGYRYIRLSDVHHVERHLGVPGRDVGDSSWMSEDLRVEW
ncbi:MAG: hypothetical protein ACFCVC_05910 [Acidimicrobiia bacterium]